MKKFTNIVGAIMILIAAVIIWGHATNPNPAPDLSLIKPADVKVSPDTGPYQFAPKNPYLADSINPLPHGDPAQQDTTAVAGPLGQTRTLGEDEITYRFLGPGHFGAYNSAKYADGRSVLWTTGVNGIFKLDEETYEVLAHLPSEAAGEYTQDWAEEITADLDEYNGTWALGNAVKVVLPLMDLSGIYCVIGSNGWFYTASKDGLISAYGDAVAGDPDSAIELKAQFQMPPEAAGPSVGMNMTYDGWVILPTEMGYVVAVSQDLSEYRMVQLDHDPDEDMENQSVGYGWVRNALALDDEGGVYIASRNHMHKIIWRDQAFSKSEADGAWRARYRNSTGQGTGATPSLMGFGDEDRFVVIADGDHRMNLTLFWRDDIPEDWEQLEHAPSRRIAALAPVTMGELNVSEIQSEQSVVVSGYGALVVNNTPRNLPFYMPNDGFSRGFYVGPLGSNPDFQPYGLQKFHWDPEARTLYNSWTRHDISSPNCVPWVSAGSKQLYFIGARNNKWTLEALNWYTGEETFHYVLGGQKYNSQFSGTTIDEKGRIFYGTMWGRARLDLKRP
ncbi:MAG: hypothetical protein ACON4W_04245 [Parvibaculales bacterium]